MTPKILPKLKLKGAGKPVTVALKECTKCKTVHNRINSDLCETCAEHKAKEKRTQCNFNSTDELEFLFEEVGLKRGEIARAGVACLAWLYKTKPDVAKKFLDKER